MGPERFSASSPAPARTAPVTPTAPGTQPIGEADKAKKTGFHSFQDVLNLFNFHRKPEQAVQAPHTQAVNWQPRSKVGDGSFRAPANEPGMHTQNAPKPGQGKLDPPGLSNGNSILRYTPAGAEGNYTLLSQDGNACGTTSLSMILNFFGVKPPAPAKRFEQSVIDPAIRQKLNIGSGVDMFTSPIDVAEYAEKQGLDAAVHNNTTLEELYQMVDQGLPVQVLLDSEGTHDIQKLHYEVVTGYGTGPDGKRYVELLNPWGEHEYMPEDTFKKRWSDISQGGVSTRINRLAVVMKPKNNPAKLLDDDRSDFVNSGIVSLRAVESLTKAINSARNGDIKSFTTASAGLGFNAVWALAGIAGHEGRQWANGVMHGGAEKIQSGKPLDVLAGVGQVVSGAVVTGVSAAAEVVGNVGSFATAKATEFFDWAGDGLGKLFGR